MAGPRVIHAAGGVVWRRRPPRNPEDAKDRVEVLLVHRPGYDDWTFPKGKPDKGESLPVTAVREIQEETGYTVRLGHPLPETMYRVKGGMKRVSYWVARPVGKPAEFKPNDEIDEVRWVRVKEARKLLTYDHDRILLKAFTALRDAKAHRTRTVIVLRHAQARTRNGWKADDLERPLTKPGESQARKLAPLLQAYGVRGVLTSPAIRCAQTVDTYARSVKALMEVDDRLAEDTKPRAVERSIATVLDRKGPIVVCSHRPTLPWIFASLRVEPRELAQGEGLVIHHRRGRVVAVEPFAHRAARH
ncbi:MAG TPA: NUDIX hydrolase [Aeromicrobium sp.]|nr:NUDIX hydrolase [Aeromicrobium sp.]HKY58562.1 NUDIX hydrolase [Aeromicrobium sp.]